MVSAGRSRDSPLPDLRGEGEVRGRIVRIDGVAQTGSGVLADYLEIVWVTPAMDGLFTGAASERRRFLDRLILCFDPGYRTIAGRFERAMTARNRLLCRWRARQRAAHRLRARHGGIRHRGGCGAARGGGGHGGDCRAPERTRCQFSIPVEHARARRRDRKRSCARCRQSKPKTPMPKFCATRVNVTGQRAGH